MRRGTPCGSSCAADTRQLARPPVHSAVHVVQPQLYCDAPPLARFTPHETPIPPDTLPLLCSVAFPDPFTTTTMPPLPPLPFTLRSTPAFHSPSHTAFCVFFLPHHEPPTPTLSPFFPRPPACKMPAVTEPAQLVGEYTLTKVNGQAPGTPAPVVLKITADPNSEERVKVETRVANMFNGFLEVRDGKVKGMVRSTRMMGNPAQREVERVLNSGFLDGMEVARGAEGMKMTCASGTLEWTVSAPAA